MQHVTALQAQEVYGEPLGTNWHKLTKAGLSATALPGCPALLSSHAKVTPQYHCMFMQHVTRLQEFQEVYSIPPDTT